MPRRDHLPLALAIAAAFAVVIAGCGTVDPLTGSGSSTPAFYAKNVKGYGETAAGLPPDEVLAYDLTVVGETARWRECTSATECTTVERTRPSTELVGVERVGTSRIDGRTIEVVKLSLTARPKYIVPTWKP